MLFQVLQFFSIPTGIYRVTMHLENIGKFRISSNYSLCTPLSDHKYSLDIEINELVTVNIVTRFISVDQRYMRKNILNINHHNLWHELERLVTRKLRTWSSSFVIGQLLRFFMTNLFKIMRILF